jgi:hypothetical protein
MTHRENQVVEFSRIDSDGNVTHVASIPQERMAACPFSIMAPEHYISFEKCGCYDAEHRAFMMREWEYLEEDFIEEGIINEVR